jgi:hypothetical protein
MSDRDVFVRYGYSSRLSGTRLECRAPQGSPISPIISILYFYPILWLNDPSSRFGYADDVSILAIREDIKETTHMLQ